MMRGIRAAWARVPADVRLLLFGLLLVAPLRIAHTALLRWMCLDGGYYTDIARHVRDGEGLTTSVSLYGFGYDHFPYPTSVYPLWPLLLGYVSRVVDLATAAHWLPLGFYFTAVIAAFIFGKRAWPEPVMPWFHPALHGGHVVAALLAFNRLFVFFTSLPYTEGLSWTLFFLWLWRALRPRQGPELSWAFEQAGWLCLLYFSRYQFLVLPLAVAAALGVRVLVGPDRLRWLRSATVTLGIVTLVLTAWLLHLRGFVEDSGPMSLLRFDQNRSNDLLSDFDVIVSTGSFSSTILDRLEGLSLSLEIGNADSWVPSFAAVTLAPVAAALIALFSLRRPAPGWRLRALERLRAADSVAWLTLGLVAIGGAVSIYAAHKHYIGSWYFSKRQGLVSILAFLLPLMWLLRRSGLPALLGGLLLAGNVSVGTYGMVREVIDANKENEEDDPDAELVGWLNQHASPERPLTVAMEGEAVRHAAWRTTDVGYHSFSPQSTFADLDILVHQLGVAYLILPDEQRKWTFWNGGAGRVEAMFEVLPEHPSGFTILHVREVPVPRAVDPPPRVVIVEVDGATWKVLEPMVEAGELPTLARLYRLGASQSAFGGLGSGDPAAAAITLATGRRAEDQGIVTAVEVQADASVVPARSTSRRVPAIWEVAGTGGRTVDVVNGWASWPAEAVHGIWVSDHANPAAGASGATAEDTCPPELAATLGARWIDPVAFPIADLRSRSGLNEAQGEAIAKAHDDDGTVWSAFRTAYTIDAPHVAIVLDRLRTTSTNLTMLHLRGPDPVQHVGWDRVEPYAFGSPPAHPLAENGAVQAYYRTVDTWLAELIEAAGPEATVIVLSNQGAEPCAAAVAGTVGALPGCHSTSAKGVLFITGPGVRPGALLTGAEPSDVEPTLAWLLGLPVSQELRGRPLSEAFLWEYAAKLGRSDVTTYGPRPALTAPETTSPRDAGIVEQLHRFGDDAAVPAKKRPTSAAALPPSPG